LTDVLSGDFWQLLVSPVKNELSSDKGLDKEFMKATVGGDGVTRSSSFIAFISIVSHCQGGIQDDEYLSIDEVLMISSKALNQVEFICRKVRGNTTYFGNLTVVLSGDLWQLPPVKN
jgi:hypothetical protein